jgi:hypothetical protein
MAKIIKKRDINEINIEETIDLIACELEQKLPLPKDYIIDVIKRKTNKHKGEKIDVKISAISVYILKYVKFISRKDISKIMNRSNSAINHLANLVFENEELLKISKEIGNKIKNK